MDNNQMNGNNNNNNNNNNRNNKNGQMFLAFLLVSLVMLFIMSYVNSKMDQMSSEEITYSRFLKMVEEDKVESVEIGSSEIKITPKEEKKDTKVNNGLTTIKKTYYTGIVENPDLLKTLEKHDVNIKGTIPDNTSVWIYNILSFVIPLVLVWVLLGFLMRRMGGGGVMGVGKSNAKVYVEKQTGVTFKDVAGEDEAKESLQEVVDFLHNPKRYTEIGAKLPKGALLVGPPGTGKTLLAKAVAGEANVPFFSLAGSSFVEMFVGVGASRVRDLFENAKKNAPSIIFIDEIDAVGRRRGNGMGGGHDEREQTLNQLLVEMDGFEGDEGVIVMAATNRSDVLDPALLRPGRFDRKILVGRPDVKGREAILKVHAKNKPLAKDVDLKIIAKQTPGFVGADLANLLNEAALLAARRNKKEIDASDVDEAEDRVIAGPAKRDRVISKKERETVAFHEAGHTIVGLVLNDARVVHKVTIVPRGRAGGYAIMLPKEDQMLLSKKDLKEQIAGLMGGRAAEELIFNQQSSGASNDFQQATQLARSMVTEYGMSEKLGPVQYEGQSGMFAGDYVPGQQPFSIDTSNAIDSEVKALCEEGMATAKKIIEEHKEQHRIIAEALLEYETLDERQILSLYKTGKMPAQAEDEFPSEKAATFEEAKEALIRKDAVKQEESHRDELEDEFPSEENLKQADSEDSDKSENETNEPKNDDDKDE